MVNGYPTRILCEDLRDKSNRRRRLASIELKNLPAGCYDKEGDYIPISSNLCTCHSDCQSCGFKAEIGVNPSGPNHCLACKKVTGNNPQPVLTFAPGKRYGTCALPVVKDAGCYGAPTDVDKIRGCSCHESCRTCGYSSNPLPSSNGECLTCKDKDHIVRDPKTGLPAAADTPGLCALPSTGTDALVKNPDREIWEDY